MVKVGRITQLDDSVHGATNTLRALEAINEAVAAERERCAKIAENWRSSLRPGTEARRLGHEEAAREIAVAIRNKE